MLLVSVNLVIAVAAIIINVGVLVDMRRVRRQSAVQAETLRLIGEAIDRADVDGREMTLARVRRINERLDGGMTRH